MNERSAVSSFLYHTRNEDFLGCVEKIEIFTSEISEYTEEGGKKITKSDGIDTIVSG